MSELKPLHKPQLSTEETMWNNCTAMEEEIPMEAKEEMQMEAKGSHAATWEHVMPEETQ